MRNRAAIAESRRRDAGREHQEQPQVKPGTKGGRLAPVNDSLTRGGFNNQELITLPAQAAGQEPGRKRCDLAGGGLLLMG